MGKGMDLDLELEMKIRGIVEIIASIKGISSIRAKKEFLESATAQRLMNKQTGMFLWPEKQIADEYLKS